MRGFLVFVVALVFLGTVLLPTIRERTRPAATALPSAQPAPVGDTSSAYPAVTLEGPPPPRPPAASPPAAWGRVACPQGGDTSSALMSPRRARPGEILDTPLPTFPHTARVVRAGTLTLPTGRLLESGAEYDGQDGTPVAVAEGRGRFPYFFLMVGPRSGGRTHEAPAMAQLVLRPGRTPIRWTDDPRFGFGTDAGSGFLGSPEAAALLARATGRDARSSALSPFFEAFVDSRVCVRWRHRSGADFFYYANGWGDGSFPGAAGYDARGDLVAITWFFGWYPWALAGVPGQPPAPVREQLVRNGGHIS